MKTPPIAVDEDGQMYRPVTLRRWVLEAVGGTLAGLLPVALAIGVIAALVYLL